MNSSVTRAEDVANIQLDVVALLFILEEIKRKHVEEQNEEHGIHTDLQR